MLLRSLPVGEGGAKHRVSARTPAQAMLFRVFPCGVGLSGSLIVVIGARNAFWLRQGLRRELLVALATTCFLSDAALVALGCARPLAPLFRRPAAWRLLDGMNALTMLSIAGSLLCG